VAWQAAITRIVVCAATAKAALCGVREERIPTQNCKLGYGSGSGLSLSKRYGPISDLHTKFFSQRRTLLSPVTVEAIELIKSWLKMTNCDLFGRV